MNRKGKLSFTDQMRIRYALHGIAWMIAGVFKFFDNIPCRFISTVAIAVSVFLLVKFMHADRELEDEMARENLHKAKSATLDSLRIIACVVLIIFAVIDIAFSTELLAANIKSVIVPIMFIWMGIENLLIGLFFNRFDKE